MSIFYGEYKRNAVGLWKREIESVKMMSVNKLIN